MTMRDTLTALLQGQATPALLHNCRLAAFGGEHFGEEAIRQQFRAQPHALTDAAQLLESPRGVALFDGAGALFADVHDGHLVRIWRLGPGIVSGTEARMAVAFDADLTQARGLLNWRAADHPDLAPDAHIGIEQAAQQLIAEDDAYRTRVFVLRAFTVGSSTATLLALHRLGPDAVRTSAFTLAAALIRPDRTMLVCDPAGEAAALEQPWRPAL